LFLGVSKTAKGEEVQIPSTRFRCSPASEARISVFWGLAPSATTIQDCTFNATQTLTPDAMWIAAKTEEGGHFTEIGWRAGCMRSQHYGPKNEQIKVIFIDPYICFCRGLVPIKEKK
jgi:hypothetical protein